MRGKLGQVTVKKGLYKAGNGGGAGIWDSPAEGWASVGGLRVEVGIPLYV